VPVGKLSGDSGKKISEEDDGQSESKTDNKPKSSLCGFYHVTQSKSVVKPHFT